MTVDIESFIKAVFTAAPSQDVEGLKAGLHQALSKTENPTECLQSLLQSLESSIEKGEANSVIAWCLATCAITRERCSLSDVSTTDWTTHAQAASLSGDALIALNFSLPARSYLEPAVAIYQSLTQAGAEQLRPNAAHSLMSLGNALLNSGDLQGAQRAYRTALDNYNRLIQAGAEQFRANAADTHMNLGSALLKSGDLPGAQREYRTALEDYNRLIQAGADQFRANAADTHMNLGSALRDSGDLPGAQREFRMALEDYNRLIQAGAEQFRANAAMTHTNLGIALNQSGDLSGAQREYRTALEDYNRLIQAGAEQFRAEAAMTHMNLGSALRHSGDLPGAQRAYRTALDEYNRLIQSGAEQFRAEAAHTHVSLGSALCDSGDLPGAQREFRTALEDYNRLIQAGAEQFRANAAMTHMNLGITLYDSGDLSEAQRAYRTALDVYNRLIRAGAEQFRADAAQIHMNLGTALCDSGDLPGAQREYRIALDEYNRLIQAGAEQFRSNAAMTHVNLGSALLDSGDLPGAQREYRTALEDYNRLIQAGAEQFRAYAARTHMNLGIVLADSGDLPGAQRSYHAALDDYNRLIQAGAEQFRAYAAHAHMNLGNALRNSGDLPGAQRAYRTALDDYNRLIQAGAEQFRVNAAMTHVNLGNVLIDSGDMPRAQRAYRTALDNYNRLIQAGAKQFRADAARTHMNLGIGLSQSDDLLGALKEYRTAQGVYLELRQRHDQFQHLAHEIKVYKLELALMMRSLDETAADEAFDLGEIRRRMNNISRELEALKNLSEPAVGQRVGDVISFRCMLQLLDSCWTCTRTQTNNILDTERQYLAWNAWLLWLQFAPVLLGEGRPEFLRSTSSEIEQCVLDMLRWRLDASPRGPGGRIVDWVLRTQGLRAQTDLLADSPDSEVQSLARLVARINQLDQGLDTGGLTGQSFTLRPDERQPISGLSTAPDMSSLSSQQFERDRLVMERNKLRAALTAKGKLSDFANHTEVQLRERLQPHEALWFLYPMPEDKNTVRLLILRLNTTEDNQALTESVDFAELNDRSTSWSTQLNQLDAALSQSARGQSRGAAARETNRCLPTSPAEDVNTQNRALWRAPEVLLPFLKAAKQQQGLRRVHLVPLGDAHALPWANALTDFLQESGMALNLRQYPSVSAWVKSQDAARELRDTPTNQPVRPLIMHDDGAEFDRIKPPALGERGVTLSMVPYEVAWTRKLWQQLPVKPLTLPSDAPSTWPPAVDPAAPIDALFGIGHGGAPHEETSDGGIRVNWARSGLWMPGWPDEDHSVDTRLQRYLSASHMPALAHTVRLFMSCCVLGRTEDQLGEPLGLIALGFGFKTRVAIGSLLSVNDVSATLISLAFQHRLIERGGGNDIDWVDTFQDLRHTLKSGQWPPGFQNWLQAHLLGLVEDLQQNQDEKRWVTWLDDVLNFAGWEIRPIPLNAKREGRHAWLAEAWAELQNTAPCQPGAPVVEAIDWYVALG